MKTDSLYRIPNSIVSDIGEYTKALKDFQSEKMDTLKFKVFRVSRGVYEHRCKGSFMMRIRIPGGGLTGTQMRKIAQLCRDYGNQSVHVTDRQDVQLHGVELDRTPQIMRELLEVGLTTKGGGGNTVRNVTACWAAGVCGEDVFDVTPYAIGMTEYMIKDPASFTLPRKYKIAFSGCGKDCAFATVNDLGLIARKENRGSEEIRGFKVYVAGGMGAYSRTAEVLEEFIPAAEVGYVAEAVKRLFDKHGSRKNRHKARLRFVMDRYGLEKFKEIYREELQNLKNKEKIALDIRPLPCGSAGSGQRAADSQKETEDFLQWRNRCITPQKDGQFSLLEVGLPVGLIPADQLEKLGELADRFADGTARTTHNQNLSLRWIRNQDLPSLYEEMKSGGFNLHFGGSVSDVICCPGSSTCQLGICLSRGLGKAVTESLDEVDSKGDIRDIRIRISGCPNSCGQHPIGPIGLHGVARRIDNHLTPFYKVLLGGRTEDGKAVLGTDMGMVPAKNIPALLAEFIKEYRDERLSGEDFYVYLDRCGKEKMQGLIKHYSHIPAYEENRNYYVDWDAKEDFSLAGRGTGECGAGVLDMIESDIAESRKILAEAASMEEASLDLFEGIYRGTARAARALLVIQGLEAKNEREAFNYFEEKFINQGLADKKFLDLFALTPQMIRDEGKNRYLTLAQELQETVQELYDSMDDSLRIQTKSVASHPPGRDKEETHKFMDLRGTPCPFNYVKAKLFMEGMDKGEIVEILLDDGDPIENVPKSLKNDDQNVMEIVRQDEHFKIVVEKTN